MAEVLWNGCDVQKWRKRVSIQQILGRSISGIGFLFVKDFMIIFNFVKKIMVNLHFIKINTCISLYLEKDFYNRVLFSIKTPETFWSELLEIFKRLWVFCQMRIDTIWHLSYNFQRLWCNCSSVSYMFICKIFHVYMIGINEELIFLSFCGFKASVIARLWLVTYL